MAKSKRGDADDIQKALAKYPTEDLISALLQTDIALALLEAAEEHHETIKQGSAIKKVVFLGRNWGPRRPQTSGGWKRKCTNNRAQKVNVVVTYLDGTTQKHTIKTNEEVEYSNGQYIFPDAGETT